MRPSAKVFGVEPDGAPKLQRALKERKVVTIETPASIADGLIPRSIGELAFQACSRFVDGAFVASDAEIASAVKLMARQAHIFAEPSGAIPVAALLAGKGLAVLGRRVVLVISGGNVSLSWLLKTLAD